MLSFWIQESSQTDRKTAKDAPQPRDRSRQMKKNRIATPAISK